MIYVAAKLPEQPVLTSPDENGSKAISVRPTRRHGGRVLAMASAVAATSVSEILRPHRKADSVAEREGFGPWVSPERVGPESSNENHRRYPGGPGVRISLPPAVSQTNSEAGASVWNGKCRRGEKSCPESVVNPVEDRGFESLPSAGESVSPMNSAAARRRRRLASGTVRG